MRSRVHRIWALSLAVVLGLTACGSSTAKSASPKTTTPIASTTTLPPTPCGRPSTIRVGSPPPVELTMAALLGFTVTVDSTRTAKPRCVVPSAGPVIHLHLGDRIEYEANSLPSDPSRPTPLSRIVSISSHPLPSSAAPFRTPHVLVTLTAVAPGTATVSYTDCSGTGC